MPRQIVVFDFHEKPAAYTVGRSVVDAVVWRGRIYDRDWSDDDTADDSALAEPACLVTEDGARFKPSADQDPLQIASLMKAAAAPR